MFQGFGESGGNVFFFSGSWGSTGYYVRGCGVQAHEFREVRNPARK